METAKCSSCKTSYDKKLHIPRVLPQCGHTFCEACIRKSTKASRRSFTCPIDKQTQVLWKQIEQLPTNKAIYDTLTGKEHGQSKLGHKYSFGSLSNDNTIDVCSKHNKPLEFTCRYDSEDVCVDCLLFTNHKNHEFYRIAGQPQAGQVLNSPRATSVDSQYSRIPLDKVTALTKQILEEPNSFQKALNSMRKQLVNEVSEIFKNYHKKLQEKEEEATNNIDKMIQKCQSKMTSTKGRLQDHLRNSVKIQKKVQDLRKNTGSNSKQVDQIIKQLNAFSDNIVEEDRKVQESVETYTQQCKQQVRSTQYWRVLADCENITLKRTISHNNKSHSRKVSCTKSQKSTQSGHIRVQNSTNEHKQSSGRSRFRTDSRPNCKDTSPKRSQTYGLEGLNQYNPSFWKQSSPQKFSSLTTRFNRSRSSNGRQNSQQSKHPQFKYSIRCKIDEVVQMIRKQPVPNLELIDLQIKDYFIQSIVDTIKQTGKKIGVIKLVKNEITDDGFKTLLKGLRDYPYLHSLNLTSNQLTQQSLDSILEFRLRNKTLTNFYLAGNCISGSKCRQKKRIMYEYGINLFL